MYHFATHHFQFDEFTNNCLSITHIPMSKYACIISTFIYAYLIHTRYCSFAYLTVVEQYNYPASCSSLEMFSRFLLYRWYSTSIANRTPFLPWRLSIVRCVYDVPILLPNLSAESRFFEISDSAFGFCF